MPRTARLDTPGLLHHVMIRGIERRRIFSDDKDRENFLKRLSMRIPFDSGHQFRLIPDSDSIPSRTVIPVEAGHLFTA